jgi:L-xylulokinase
MTGGAARSEVWVQIFADCLQIPIEVPEATELGALGAAICASVAAECYPSYEQAISQMVRFSHVQKPRAEAGDLYQRKYNRYRKLLEKMEPVWKELNPR